MTPVSCGCSAIWVPASPASATPTTFPEPSEEPYVKPGDLWVLGDHLVLCGDATNPDDVARLLGGATPRLLATDPPYGVSLDPTWRDQRYNGLGPAEKSYMRIEGHQNTTLSGPSLGIRVVAGAGERVEPGPT